MNQLDINEIRRQAALRQARQRYPGLGLDDQALQADPLAGVPAAVRNFNPEPAIEPKNSATEVMRMLQSMGKVPEAMGASIGGNQPTQQATRPQQGMGPMGVPMAPVDPKLPPLSDTGQLYADLSRITKPLDDGFKAPSAQQVWEELYARDSARASGMRSIAEGLGNIRAITAGDILHKTHAAEPFIAEDLRTQQGEVEDRMSPDQAAALGLEYKPGMTKGMAQPLLRAKESEADRAAAEARLNFMVERDLGVRDRFDRSSDIRERTLGGIKDRYEDTQLNRVRRDFDSAVKAHRESLIASDKALAALDTGTSTGDMASIVQLARAAGEKGPLSNQDVAMYRYRMGLLNSVQDRLTQIGTGRMSEAQRTELRQILTEFRGQTQSAISQAEQRFVERNTGRLGWDEDMLRGTLEAGTAPQAAPRQEAPQPPAQAGSGAFVHVVNPETGEEAEVDAADAEEAQRRGWRRVGQ